MRIVNVSVGGLALSQFKIDFRITKTLSKQLDWDEISIYNLSAATESSINSGEFISISAGLEGNVGLLVDGYIDRIEKEMRRQNRVIKFFINGGGASNNYPIIVDSGEQINVKASEVFRFYADIFGRTVIENAELLDEGGIVFPGVFSPGTLTPREGMDLAIERIRISSGGRVDLTYEIEPARILVLDRNPNVRGNVVAISEATGLIGTPKNESLAFVGGDAVRIETVLDPRIKLESYIDLRSRFAESGIYRVQEIEHRGSNIDGDFKTITKCVKAGQGT